VVTPSAGGCEDCLKTGDAWVQMTCSLCRPDFDLSGFIKEKGV
jgi:hypothetical protein